MKAIEAKELFYEIAAEFFENYNVIFANQSRIAKPQIPLVVLSPGNIRRPQAENGVTEDGAIIGYYQSRMPIVVDLFTNGKPVKNDNDDIIAYSNTAIDEILAFADYLNSPKCISWSDTHDVSILIEKEAQDLTGAINDNNYEYRSRLEVLFYFTQETNQANGDMGYFSALSPDE